MHDVAILGGGHNGLVASAYLARAGLNVVVLEKNALLGGAAITEEFAPGFRNSVASYAVSLLNPKVIADLDLKRFGLEILERPVANFWPIDVTRALLMPHGTAARAQAIAQISPRDGERLPAYDAALEQATAVIRDLVLRTPPNLGGGLLDLISAGSISRRLLGLTRANQRLLSDLFLKSAADFLGSWFESDIVKGAFAFDGIVGAYAPPSQPGSAYVLLHHCFGEVNGRPGVWGHAKGGMGAISDAIAASAQAAGAILRSNAAVEEVVVENGRARGVRLASGEVIRARAVAANVAPKLLFRDLIPSGAVPDDVASRFRGLKSGSAVFRMNVALAQLPDFTCRPGVQQGPHHGSGIVIGPTLEYLETAYQDATRLGWSRAPVVEMLIPSTVDDTLAPKGQHVASLFVQYVAPKLPQGRSWDEAKDVVADLVIETVNEHAPNFKRNIIARQVLSPLDLERRFGLVDGDIFHGQLSLDQLFSLRPTLGFATYRLPIPGLYLCGSGAHPGGGVTGVPGHNAAREILRDFKTLLGPRAWPRAV